MCIYPPFFRSFFPYRPLEYWAEFPVEYSRSSLASFTQRSVRVNPKSTVYPSPPLFLLQPSVCFLHLWFCFVNRFIAILLAPTYKHYHLISVFLCLTSLHMTISRYIHVTAMTLFHSFNSWVIVHLYMYHIFFSHSSGVGHLRSLHVLAIVNSTAMNIAVHLSFLKTIFIWAWLLYNAVLASTVWQSESVKWNTSPLLLSSLKFLHL